MFFICLVTGARKEKTATNQLGDVTVRFGGWLACEKRLNTLFYAFFCRRRFITTLASYLFNLEVIKLIF